MHAPHSARRRRRLRAAAVTAALVAAFVAAGTPSARGADGWSRPVAVSPAGKDVVFPQAGLDGAGHATVVYMGRDGLSGEARIRVATRAPGGSWIVAADALSGAPAFSPSLAVSASGAAVAAWIEGSNPGRAWASSRVAGGAFVPAVELSTGVERTSGAPIGVALDAAGNGGLAWETTNNGNGRVVVHPVASGALAGARATIAGLDPTATSPAVIDPVSVASGASGFAAAFERRNPQTLLTNSMLIGPASGASIAAPTDLAPSVAGDGDPVIAVLADGTVVRAFTVLSEAAVWAAVGDAAPQLLEDAPSGADVFGAAIAADAEGTVVVAWIHEDDLGARRVKASVRPAGGVFSAPAPLSEPTPASIHGPVVACSGGDAWVVWSRSTGNLLRVEVSERPAGGAFPAVADELSGAVGGEDGDAAHPSIAADATGRIVVVWDQGFRDDASGLVYRRAVATDRGFAGVKPDRKKPKLSRMVVSPERFGTGAPLGQVVFTADALTQVYPEGGQPGALTAGTEFVFTSSEVGTYEIDLAGTGCLRVLPDGKRLRKQKYRDCGAFGQSIRLSGPIAAGTNRIAFLGAGLIPGGRYRATLRVRDAAGNRSGAKNATFVFDGAPTGD